MASSKSPGTESAANDGLPPDQRAAWDRLDIVQHLRNVDLDVGDPNGKKPSLFDFKINVPTIVAAGGVVWSIMQWYAQNEVWHAKVELMRESDLQAQALRDDAIKQRMDEIADQLRVIGARLDARR